MKKIILRIATRKSPLALIQANIIRNALLSLYPNWNIHLVPIITYGDIVNKPLSTIGGKGLFLKELEIALIENKADIAIHSMKDIPVINTHKGLCFSSICKRENALDALISNYYKSIDHLPYGSKIGTSSLRRQCQLTAYRSDLICIPIRGNIETRLKKLDEKKFDAIILATAALNRLQLQHRITQIIPPELSLPSCGQGALGIQFKSKDKNSILVVKILNDYYTNLTTIAERAFCKKLKSNCQISVGSYATLKDNKLWLRGLIGLPDGSTILKGERAGACHLAKKIGYSLAKEFIQHGAKKYFKLN